MKRAFAQNIYIQANRIRCRFPPSSFSDKNWHGDPRYVWFVYSIKLYTVSFYTLSWAGQMETKYAQDISLGPTISYRYMQACTGLSPPLWRFAFLYFQLYLLTTIHGIYQNTLQLVVHKNKIQIYFSFMIVVRKN